MLRRLAALVLATVSGAGVLTAVGTTASSAQTDTPFETYSWNLGEASWTMRGYVAGRPGNAHSGYLGFDTSDDPPYYALADWSCPRGVTPPTTYNHLNPEQNEPTACTIRRYVLGYSDVGPFSPVFSGPLESTISDDYSFQRVFPTVGPEYVDRIDVRFRRVGPVTRTWTDESTAEYEAYFLVRTAPMVLRGTLGGFNLNDPRVKVTVSTYFREDQYYRQVS
ncbi:exported hypothetical protein [metagenome]|uniref:Uncharacterized protein n=1 Tax=metagenome TaxID=256318 RepID=A0A2P2CE02_9ZZZZ